MTEVGYPLDLVVDELLPPDVWLLVSDGVAVLGSHRVNVARFYERFGFVRAPWEGRFAFRLRAELSARLMVRDANALRDRLYAEWKRRL